MIKYSDSEIAEAKLVVEYASKNWPFKQLNQQQIDKIEWASRVLRNKEVFGVESPF